MVNQAFYSTKIGILKLITSQTQLINLSFAPYANLADVEKSTPNRLSYTTILQLEQYLSGTREVFDLPLALKDTDFQKKVWRELQKTPYGATKSYKDIALAINNPKGARAVGMANNKNPIAVIIPCHRAVGANGSLVGYAGGLELKQKLLNLEKT